MKLCLCGCRKEVTSYRFSYLKGHYLINRKMSEEQKTLNTKNASNTK